MKQATRYTVVGAGHGGKSMAAHLALMGKEVTLYNRTQAHIDIICKRKGIELESYPDGPHGFGMGKLKNTGAATKHSGAVGSWPDRCGDWMRGLGLLDTK